MLIETAAPRIGAIATGIDVRSLTEEDWRQLYQTWLDRHVLVVRGQTLSKPDFISYSRRFGRLKPHRVKSTRDPEHPEVTLMGVTTGNSTNDRLVLDRGQGWHPETGRSSLYLGRRPNAWIVGLSDADSDALLDELWAHVQQGPHLWTQEWRQGDLVIWDNRCTLHRRNQLDPSLRRLMHRTQVRDKTRPVAAGTQA